MDPELKRELSASKMRLRSKSPYFSVLTSYLKPIQVAEDSSITTAATDGLRLFVAKQFWMKLRPTERDFVLVHEVLHAALNHCSRRGARDPIRWNVAADYVVNLIAKDAKFDLLQRSDGKFDILLDEKYRKMSTEEVYAILPKEISLANCLRDVLQGEAGDLAGAEKTWRVAKAQAKAAVKTFGSDPLGDVLSIELEKSTVDWRQILWRDLSVDDVDFANWDRRLVGDELFVEALEPVETPSKVALFVDTSGSTMGVLGKFCGEGLAIFRMCGGKGVDLWYSDCELHGPFGMEELARPRGGGGTSFVPAFEEAEKRRYRRVVYLTDLDGQYPAVAPKCEVTWVVPPGCREDVPFGKVVKIL